MNIMKIAQNGRLLSNQNPFTVNLRSFRMMRPRLHAIFIVKQSLKIAESLTLSRSTFALTSIRHVSAGIDIKEEIEQIVKNNKVVLFMKGIPEAPKCGFSNAVVQILRMHGVEYESHDVLEDDRLRQGIKEYSNWPTIPQVFVNGEFIGGCDVMLQLHQNGELIEELQKAGIRSSLLDGEDLKK